MSKSLRIVLVDPRGDVLFSGESMTAKETLVPWPINEVDDACPPTMRSPTSESGIFAAAAYAVEQEGIDALSENREEIRSSRPRAA